MNTIQINPADNVIVALSPLAKGTAVAVPGVGEVVAAEDIPQGHKMAVRSIAAGEDVIKYGLPIGHVTGDVQPGQWLHTHNVKTNLSGEVEYAYNPTHPVVESVEPETFMGFRRADGRAATRNELWIIPTVGCVNEVARAMCEQAQDLVDGSLEGVYYFPHPFGCSQTGADHVQTRRLLVALSRHPNAAGVLFLSLGCENCTHQQVLDELGDFDHERVRFLTCQDVTDEQIEGHKILAELADLAKQSKREPIPASELVECGLSAGEAALISSFAIYVNAILCPLMGFVADNFYATKIGRIFGRRRFWILLAIPMMIAEPLIFVATPFGFPYYFVLYLIYNVAYTFCTANLSPLTIEMTDDFKERTYLTGYKHLFGNAAGFLMAALVGFGFGTFGETNPFSYFIIATVNASVMAISLLCVYLSTWEHTPEEVAQEKIESVGEGIKKFFIDVISTFRNKSFRKVLYAQVSTKLAAACWSACLSFFIVYCLQIPKSYESVMEMPGKVVAIVCTAIWVALMAKKGFHKSWYLANVGCAACIIAFNYFAFGQINGTSTVAIAMIAYPIIFAIWKFFYVGFQYLPDVLLNYIPDVDELITLRRREGIYSSAQQLCQQIAQAIAVNVWAIVLAASGFIQTAGNSDAVTQPATVPLYICGYMIIGCAGFFLLAAVLARGIKIDKEQCDVLCDEIHRVKEGGKMADVKPEVKALCEELSGFKYEDCFAHNNVGFQDGSVTPAE